MKKTFLSFLYLLIDFLAVGGVWIAFVLYRREGMENEGVEYIDNQQFVNASIIAVYWLILFALAGLYGDPYRRSRIHEFTQVLKYSVVGVIIVFFAIFLDDDVDRHRLVFYIFYYFLLHFSVVAICRMIYTSLIVMQIRRRKIGYPTLLIGAGKAALRIYEDLNNHTRALGYLFQGYLTTQNYNQEHIIAAKLNNLGCVDDLVSLIKARKIEEVIIALEKEESHLIGEIIDNCEKTRANIKVVPGMYDYLVGIVKSEHIMGAPLIEVSAKALTNWEALLKRVFDIAFSSLALLALTPIYTMVAIAVKLNSKGPIFYAQERIGKNGKPFFIYKFRSMYIDAEKFGPALSKENDPRITPVGRFLRKTRLDELPQFWNVLKGDMSVVGPRPERQYFIDQIVKVAPHYRYLHKVRPGVTSWGQVKYGYAENIDEMVERLKYDIMYIENISLALDVKIILYTIIVMIEGRGK